MKVIDAELPRAIAPRHRPAAVRAARLEVLGLAVASAVVALGLFLVVHGSLETIAPAPHGEVLQLRRLASPDALVPLLTAIDEPRQRAEAARRLFLRATSPDTPLTHVGALADVRDEQGRPVLVRADLAALKPSVAVRTRDEFLRAVGMAASWFFALFWGAHVMRRWRGAVDDAVVLPLLLVLSGVGLIAMVALRDPLRDTLIASTFTWGVCGGVILLLAASEVDYESSPLRRMVLGPLALALALALALLVLGSGPRGSGVKVNLFGVQPVEAIRLLVVFAIAAVLARRFEHLRELSEAPTPARRRIALVRLPRWRDVRPVVVSMAMVLSFFFLQKDLGPALVLSGVVLALYATARGRVSPLVIGGAMLVTAFAAAYVLGFPPTVGERVRIWSNPWNNGVAGGSQIAQGLWAMSTGAALGRGPGLGSPQSIPEGHTDFVLAALGEELGVVGVVAVIGLYALLAWRCLRIAVRAPGDYSALLAIGVTLALVVQAIVIAGGVVGLLPLTGVVTPFLSYGRSAMLANFVAVGVVSGVARRRGPVRRHLALPVQRLAVVLAVLGLSIALRAFWIQVVRADAQATEASLTLQADEGYRFEYNPRLVAAARAIERGTIRDRNGLVIATSNAAEIAGIDAAFAKSGIRRSGTPCSAEAGRCYPLGGIAFSVLGDWQRQTNWGARNSSYLERDRDARLKGFDDRQRLVDVVHPVTGDTMQTIRRDYGALLPIVRFGRESARADVRAVLDETRDLMASIDARLQDRTAAALADGIARGAHSRGAAVVLDVLTGEVLASVSYPWPTDLPAPLPPTDARAIETRLDRVRYGLYPPGSTFKLLVAAAALRSRPDLPSRTFSCAHLAGGRVGQAIKGWPRPVRDDVKDTTPHGDVDLHRGLVVSCNAYFAQLATQIGPQALLDAANAFQVQAANPATAASLRERLPYAGYGQGEVLASPLNMARVAAAIAAGGVATPASFTASGDSRVSGRPAGAVFLTGVDATRLARYMREAVTSGTGRSLASNATPIAGKTGTAEVDNAPSHSWFVGFAPYGGSRPIAFAVIVEHAGYGGSSAAPIAGAIVDAARELGLFR